MNKEPTTVRELEPIKVRIPPKEHAELSALAKEAGVSINDACRIGARIYLLALTAPRTKRGRPKKDRETT